MSEIRECGCTCFLGHAPCTYCEYCSKCRACGNVYFDRSRFDDDKSIAVCEPCQDAYRHKLEGHQLDCTCRPCMAFVNARNAEEGFLDAIPIMIEEEHAHATPN